MLSKIAIMDAGVIRALLVAVVGLLGLVLSFFGVDEQLFSEKASRVVDAFLLVLTAGSVFYAAYARATKPTPPITEMAVNKSMEMQAKQGGFIRAGVLGLLLAFSVVSASVLPACTMIGVPTARTFNERLATGYSSVSAVRETATTLLNGGQISSSDAENVQLQADNARAALDIARTVSATDMSAADAKLQATLTVLIALDNYLRTKS